MSNPVQDPDFARHLAQSLIKQYPAVKENKNITDDLESPQVGCAWNLTHASAPFPVAGDVLGKAFCPAFLRRRYVPPRHHLATEEMGREPILDDEESKDSSMVAAFSKKNNEEKEETWNRLNELATFALAGFLFFTVKMGALNYNRERRDSVLRQSLTGRDTMWGQGLRVPFGDRICHGAASLSWGEVDDSSVGEEVVLLSDCYPVSQDVYDVFAVNRGKYDPRGEHPVSLGLFLRCAKQHIMIWRTFFGSERRVGRVAAMGALGKLHEAHPDLFIIPAIVSAWAEMTCRYVTDVKECTRKMVRMLPETVREGEFRRKSLSPMSDGRSRWGYPTTFLYDASNWVLVERCSASPGRKSVAFYLVNIPQYWYAP